jgi:predicted HNH restriction endonuclease
MAQTLIITEELFYSLSNRNNATILRANNITTSKMFLDKVIAKLNNEFNFLEITKYAFPRTDEEKSELYQYSGLVVGDNLQHDKVVVFFTPIDTKTGNVVIEQSLMPTICTQMEKDKDFLLTGRIKKIALLTSQINSNNTLSTDYNKMQMDINSLNTLNFDVIPFFQIKNLSTDTKFNSLTEYIEMTDFLQRKNAHNAQNKNLIVKKNILIGDCDATQIKGEFQKSFCFRFLTAMLAGGNDYKYDITRIINKLNSKTDKQLNNLRNFIEFTNNGLIKQAHFISPVDEDIVESDDEISNINDIHRTPEKAFDNSNGRKRYKTQKKIRDTVLQSAEYLCNCHDQKHFYFEAVDLQQYVEGHHTVPMNRQEEYYFGKEINLDIPQNMVALCPNCHAQIHLGSRQARLTILSELYIRNKAQLLSFDKDLTLVLLASYYNIGLENEEEAYWLKKAQDIVSKKHSGKI